MVFSQVFYYLNVKKVELVNLCGYLVFFILEQDPKFVEVATCAFVRKLYFIFIPFSSYKRWKSRQVVQLFKYTKLHLETLQCLCITHVLQQLLMPEIYRFSRLENQINSFDVAFHGKNRNI